MTKYVTRDNDGNKTYHLDPTKKKVGSMSREERAYIKMEAQNEVNEIIERYGNKPFYLELLAKGFADHVNKSNRPVDNDDDGFVDNE